MHVLIIGLGKSGKLLAQQLLKQGHQVTGISRRSQQLDGVCHVAQSVHEADYAQLPPIDWVYVLLTPDERSVAAYQHTFIDSLQPIATALSTHPIQKVVFVSSTSVYGQGQGELVNELTAPQPETPTAQVLWQAEQQWKAYWQDRLVVVRPSGLYANDRLRLIRWVQEAKPVPMNVWTNRIHIEDLAGILARLIDMTDLSPCYLATDGHPVFQDEVLDQIAVWLELAFPMKIMAPTTGKQLKSCLLNELSYNFRYPTWKEGYAAIVKSFFDR